MLPLGATVKSPLLGDLVVKDLVGEGGQGWVFSVYTDKGKTLALKWYKPGTASLQQWDALEELISRGAPHARFLWPADRVTRDGRVWDLDPNSSFGYVMPLRDPEYRSMTRVLTGNVDENFDTSFSAIITMCRHLVEAFRQLHSRGLCYRDINLGNLFVHPTTSDVMICDVDNIGVDDGTSRVLGTPMFMAPEIIADRTHSTLPSKTTDLHSLAVLLFQLLFMEHPLEGKRTDVGIRDEEHHYRHFGVDPLYCLSATNPANRPVSDHVVKYWRLYPSALRERFAVAFGPGLKSPRERVTETEWAATLARLRDSLCTCAKCGSSVFYDPMDEGRSCEWCGEPLGSPLMFVAGKRKLVVSPKLEVTTDLFSPGWAKGEVIGQAKTHPDEPQRVGLQNRAEQPWRAVLPDGSTREIAHGQVIELLDGLTINFPHGAAVVGRRAWSNET